MRAPEFWHRAGLTAHLLQPLAQAYAGAGRVRRRLVRAKRAPVPVICVGNVVVGGAGKTPTALALARRLLEVGRRPHFLTRGYGGRVPGPLRVDPVRHDARAVGDEALLLAALAPTWVARDRPAGALAAAAAGAEVIVMDDGFQNPSLAQDLALVVVDGASGFGNGRVLPAGPLREPLADALARASAVVRVGPDEAHLHRLLPPSVPLLEADLRPAPTDAGLAGVPVVAFAGIGRPEKFFRTLASLGADVRLRVPFADHHPYRRREIERLVAAAGEERAQLVTTAKDAVRIPQDLRSRIRVLDVVLVWRDRAALDRLLAPVLAASSSAMHEGASGAGQVK